MSFVTTVESQTMDWGTGDQENFSVASDGLVRTWTRDRDSPLLDESHLDLIRARQRAQYRVHRRDREPRPLAACWLAYSAPHLQAESPEAWPYLMSACVASRRLLDDEWFANSVDRVILTPPIEDESLRALLHAVFDVHVEYLESLHFDPPPGMLCGETTRWSSVFNKIHMWNPDVFPFDRVLVMDSELIIKDFAMYRSIMALEGDFVGVSESLRIDEGCGYHQLPHSYGVYWDQYAHINAGLMLMTPDFRDFYRLKAMIHGGWEFAMQRCPAMIGRPMDWGMWCPEQELLTCYFAGRSYHMGPMRDLFSLIDTVYHWSFDITGEKIWTAPHYHPYLSNLYRTYIRDIVLDYPDAASQAHLVLFYEMLCKHSIDFSRPMGCAVAPRPQSTAVAFPTPTCQSN